MPRELPRPPRAKLDVGAGVNINQHIPIPRKLLRAGASALFLAIVALIVVPPAASAQPAFTFASHERDCLANRNVNAFLRQHHANVMRLILSPQDAQAGAGIACIRSARAAGFKVYISFQFNNRSTPGQVAVYFRRVLPRYAPFLWAVGVGNEQDLSSPTGYGQGRGSLSGHGRTVGQAYRAIWDAVEPVLVKLAPHAIRVYGEFSPWSFAANKQGFASGRPPGVQAIAAHCYRTVVGGLRQVPQDAAWAASKRLPLWCSEMGPALARPRTRFWVAPDTWASWNAIVRKITSQTPNLRMTGYYYYPDL
ncbi:MAG: hypothetical protein ACTHQQ_14945 [Solirubrobacteraceae bacterium]